MMWVRFTKVGKRVRVYVKFHSAKCKSNLGTKIVKADDLSLWGRFTFQQARIKAKVVLKATFRLSSSLQFRTALCWSFS